MNKRIYSYLETGNLWIDETIQDDNFLYDTIRKEASHAGGN